TVVTKPFSIPNESFNTFATGAKQFVVHEAFENTSYFSTSKSLSLTPKTIVCTSPPLDGPVNTTFFAPAVKCLDAVSPWLKAPVASNTISTPKFFQGKFSGLRSLVILISLPSTTKVSLYLTSTVFSHLP